MPGWDYSGKGVYFITIVTQNRECVLGEIIDGKMYLSDFGNIVKDELEKSFDIRKELTLDEYVIMPNHIHMIVILKNRLIHVGTHGRASLQDNGRAFLQGTGTGRASLRESTINRKSKSPMPQRKPRSISSFVAEFKSGVTNAIDNFIDENNLKIPKYNRDNHFFQPNYNDHIIRDKKEYFKIKNYIFSNPKNWNEDDLINDEG